ncbi:MAG: hypothetical protein K0S80_2922 [Neobacillus sp.]|nr:hypothetical protein [Neobacillus sp.]
MASISLGTLRTYWQNVSDWVTGTSTTSKPKVVILGSIAKESWEGSATVTTPFATERNGFGIKNDGDTPLTFTINGQTRTVLQKESYYAVFEPFTSVLIATTGAFRAEVFI